MKRLNQRKIRWMIRKHLDGLTSKEIASFQKISPSRVRQIISYYKRYGQAPILKKSGRKSKSINPEIINIILEIYNETNIGPLALEKEIYRKRKIHIPHNTIYKVMLSKGLIKPNPRKRKQRKYVRWERHHSNSLWQGDWKEIKIKGRTKYLIAFIDDASRLITCYGIYDNPNTENTIKTLMKGIAKYGKPLQILTDHGSQFTPNKLDKKGRAKHKFEQFLEENGIQHILASVKHPQTNGKIERWFGLVEKKKELFNDDINKIVKWYNEIKPLMSLWFEYAEKPIEKLFIGKQDQKNY